MQDPDLVSIQEVRQKVDRAYAAALKFRAYTQEQVDRIVEAMAEAGRRHARELAEAAVAETGYGNAKDKLAKNLLCADLLPRTIRGLKTIGILRELPDQHLIEVGVPVGVVAAIVPTTNPTSTVIYKSIVSLKAGNAIVISPHPRAKACTCQTAALLYQAAIQAGAPEDIIQCITAPTLDSTNALMQHKRTGVILSTGGGGIVKAAYSSGKPAFGVGPGNVPALVDESADVAEAVAKIVQGKSFDFGTVCSSEQALVAVESLRERITAELRRNQAFLCTAEQGAALAKVLLDAKLVVNPACVGHPPGEIARMAGFEVPTETSILVAEIQGVGREHPLSAEKLSPVLSLLFVKDFEAGLDACENILKFGGLGHTCVIHARDDSRIRRYGLRMPAFRVLVNTPSPQGSTGITTNVQPSMTLGCGAIAGNITSDNVGPLHLINIKRIAYVARKAEEAFSVADTPAPAPVDRQSVVAAVEKYLASRGVAVTAGSGTAPAAASLSSAAASPAAASPTASIVDRFLAGRRQAAREPAKPEGSCCEAPSDAASKAPAVSAPVAEPAAEVAVTDFVCEADVRDAIRAGRKIYVGPRTIVTPSARDLAGQHDTLVQARR
ncbi:MAG: aldehyde dehydrogenase family protein [Acidobacteria bacterium]|nr:aldehyde dehydrogenase family protein [Acidobacteriota bacterium]